MSEYLFPVSPVAKPRMTRSDKWNQRDCVVRYRQFADDLRLAALINEFTLPEAYKVVFFVPMPKSWSKKKKAEMLGKPHQQTPDTDNFIKAFQDALTDDDSAVWRVDAQKRWWYENAGFILVDVIDNPAQFEAWYAALDLDNLG